MGFIVHLIGPVYYINYKVGKVSIVSLSHKEYINYLVTIHCN